MREQLNTSCVTIGFMSRYGTRKFQGVLAVGGAADLFSWRRHDWTHKDATAGCAVICASMHRLQQRQMRVHRLQQWQM